MNNKDLIDQWRRLTVLSTELRETTEEFIKTAKKIDPSIKTRIEAIKLAENLHRTGVA